MENQNFKTSAEYQKYIIDVGSKTLKIYGINQDEIIKLLFTKSVPFDKSAQSNEQIVQQHQDNIIKALDNIKFQQPSAKIKIFGTEVFRNIDRPTQRQIINETYRKTGLVFHIISQELESFYLETALVEKCTLNEPILLMNIGGGSAQLVISQNHHVQETINLPFGVKTINDEFPQINDSQSGHPLDEIVKALD